MTTFDIIVLIIFYIQIPNIHNYFVRLASTYEEIFSSIYISSVWDILHFVELCKFLAQCNYCHFAIFSKIFNLFVINKESI